MSDAEIRELQRELIAHGRERLVQLLLKAMTRGGLPVLSTSDLVEQNAPLWSADTILPNHVRIFPFYSLRDETFSLLGLSVMPDTTTPPADLAALRDHGKVTLTTWYGRLWEFPMRSVLTAPWPSDKDQEADVPAFRFNPIEIPRGVSFRVEVVNGPTSFPVRLVVALQRTGLRVLSG